MEKKTVATKAAPPKTKISQLAKFRNSVIAKNPRLKRFLKLQKVKPEIKLAIVPFELKDTFYIFTSSDFEKNLNKVIFGSENESSLANYIKTVSYGKITVTGKVFDKVKISNSINEKSSTRQGLGNFEEWGKVAYSMYGNELDNYDYVQFVYQAEESLGQKVLGRGELTGKFSYVDALVTTFDHQESYFTHELLHNFGIDDSFTLDCLSDKQVTINCGASRYEQFGVMGQTVKGDINGVSKFILGWIDESEIKNFNQPTELIYPIEKPEIEGYDRYPRLLGLEKKDTNEFYFIEYRNKINYDSEIIEFEGGAILTYFLYNNIVYFIKRDDYKSFTDPYNGYSLKLNRYTYKLTETKSLGSIELTTIPTIPLPTINTIKKTIKKSPTATPSPTAIPMGFLNGECRSDDALRRCDNPSLYCDLTTNKCLDNNECGNLGQRCCAKYIPVDTTGGRWHTYCNNSLTCNTTVDNKSYNEWGENGTCR